MYMWSDDIKAETYFDHDMSRISFHILNTPAGIWLLQVAWSHGKNYSHNLAGVWCRLCDACALLRPNHKKGDKDFFDF